MSFLKTIYFATQKYVEIYGTSVIKEDNKKLNSTTTYSYDKGGNIVEYYVYPYSTCDTKDLSNGNKYSYAYPINGWRDQLVSFNGEIG